MDRDRRLAEMMGMCGWYCTKCDKPLRPAEVTYEENCLYCGLHLSDPDFSTPEWRARLMDWAVEQGWYQEFNDWAYDEWVKCAFRSDIQTDHIFTRHLWRNLATLIVEYHGEGRK